MVSRKFVYAIVLGLVVLSLSFSLRTTPVQTEDSMQSLLAKLERVVLQGNWDAAMTTYAQVVNRFQKYRLLIMFNNGEQDLNDFEARLSSIRGGIAAQDKATVLSEVAGAQDLWAPLVSLIPRP